MQKTDFPFEILLGEDASTDGTRELCINYAENYPDKIRLFLHHRENNIKISGIPTGRFNLMYNLFTARGKYIAICEGDDYWTDPYKLQKQVDFLETTKGYSGCFHETQVIFDNDKSFGKIYGRDAPETMTTEDTFASLSPFHTSSFVFRKENIDLPVWINEIVSTDMAIFSIVSAYGNLKKIGGVMSVYRKHDDGLTNSASVKRNFHLKRIELINHLNIYHRYKYRRKADSLVRFHSAESKKMGSINLMKVFVKYWFEYIKEYSKTMVGSRIKR